VGGGAAFELNLLVFDGRDPSPCEGRPGKRKSLGRACDATLAIPGFALAAWVASRAPRCTGLAVAGGPRFRILLPPAASPVRTSLSLLERSGNQNDEVAP
jgi:hypothetical protein